MSVEQFIREYESKIGGRIKALDRRRLEDCLHKPFKQLDEINGAKSRINNIGFDKFNDIFKSWLKWYGEIEAEKNYAGSQTEYKLLKKCISKFITRRKFLEDCEAAS